jgi:putative Mn2+ efflux pump MntP
MAVTISLTTKLNKPKVSIFMGKRIRKPTVAFNRPMRIATIIAVPKLLMVTLGMR